MSDKTASRPGSEKSARYVAVARLAILWERFWPALWPATGIMGLFAAAGLFDLFASLPQAFHLGALFLATLASGALLHANLRGFAWPRWEDGARRVETDSALAHRPITEGDDRLAAGTGDPWAEALWRAHLRRLLASIVRLRFAWPRPGLQRRDRFALRFAVLLLLVAGFVVAGRDSGKRLLIAFTPDSGIAASPASLEAWINPPAYTGEAPIYLQHPVGDALKVPAGSQLVLRVHAAHGLPNLSLSPSGSETKFAGGAGEFGATVALWHDSDVRVLADGKLLARLHLGTIADTPPVIAFAQPPSKTEHDALKIAFTAGDDYGVVAARAIIRPVNARSHTVLSVDLPLNAASAKTLTQTVFRDLTGEPLAGVPVSIVLEARDGAGQTGRSPPAYMRLPARVFTTPLARALVEQRQVLAVGAPHARDQVVLALDALTLAPERFYADHGGVYLAIRTALWSTKSARGAADIDRVEQLLWDTAVALEQGGVLAAADELRQLQQMLSQALEQGAPQEVIAALLDRYREALQRYLQMLAQNAQPGSNSMASNAKQISPQDLDAMLKAIEQMAQTGARGAAAQALAMLQNLLENLHMAQGPGGGAGDKALSDAIGALGDLIGRQRQLLDKSFRQSQGAGDPKDGGGRGLAQEQGKLRNDLDALMKKLGPGKAPHALGDAGKQMGTAQNHLGGNDFDSAEQDQKSALDALRQSADALARQMMKEAGQAGGQGEAQGTDPLGREEGGGGFGAGDGVKIPDRDTLARARSILEELRRRAAERGRPKEELDYYDRLLKEF